MNPEAARQKERKNLRRWRAAKKAQVSVKPHTPQAPETAYAAPSSLSRAVKRARSALPRSRKLKKVLLSLCDQVDLPPYQEINNSQPIPASTILSEEVKERIQEFYLRSDISWMAPGRKDCITVIRDRVKVQEQRRYHVMTTCEAHALSLEEYPNISVGLSKFKSFRPDVVLFKDKMPHNVCVCSYHANVD